MAIGRIDPATRPYIMQPGDGYNTPLGGLGCLQLVSAAVTEGRLGIVEHTLPPRGLAAPLHRHKNEDELSIVLSGRIGALLGDARVEAGPGSYVYKPRHQWHTFWNAGDEELRFIELIFPGGFEGYFEKLSALFAAMGGPNPEAIAPLAEAYGLEVQWDSVPGLCERFGVQLVL
jgi:mannose-6-phosphate isomerase-like protein (cupin superfamily)